MIGFFGDIHGDQAALQAVVEHLMAQGADRLVCLGDIVNMFPDRGGQENEQCVRFVEDLKSSRPFGCPTVMGNHDFAMRNVSEVLSWEARRFLSSLPCSSSDLSPHVLVCHASCIDPKNWWESKDLEEYRAELAQAATVAPLVRLFVLGHRHVPLLLAISSPDRQTEVLWNGFISEDDDVSFSLDFDKHSYVSVCGAVSCPLNSSRRGYGMLFDEKRGLLRMLRVGVQ